MRREVIGFLFIGGIAFFIDSGILQFLLYLDVDALIARVISIFCAIIFTWLGNRKLSFQVQTAPNLREFLKYLSTSAFGATINWTVYSLIVSLISLKKEEHIFAVAIATLVAMSFNFLSMKFLIFNKKKG